jgi:hypothetical protein
LPSSRVPRRLRDIVDNAHAIFACTEGMDLAAFEENRLVYDAVERCIERITEAASKLGDMALYLMPEEMSSDVNTTTSERTGCLMSSRPTFPVSAPPPKTRCDGGTRSSSL